MNNRKNILEIRILSIPHMFWNLGRRLKLCRMVVNLTFLLHFLDLFRTFDLHKLFENFLVKMDLNEDLLNQRVKEERARISFPTNITYSMISSFDFIIANSFKHLTYIYNYCVFNWLNGFIVSVN